VERLLEGIQGPSDLKQLTRAELKQVASEIREAVIESVSKTGGHLSSNLGTVELTVALYATYDFPPDKFIWDTGHQAYPHKMLTGRFHRFDTLRQYKGISGFLRREESPYDLFGAGHAGTGISAALGFAVARDKLGGDERVIAIAGDAALTSGLAFESLNNAAQLKTDVTVVLNDNKMSIAENVGALSTHLARLRSRPWYQRIEDRARAAVERLPQPIVRAAAGLRHAVTYYVAPVSTGAIFEEMGFQYIGPIDGHDLDVMLDIFDHAKHLKGPIFIHVLTVKGKGYEVAEHDARKWHGVTPFTVSDGKIERKSSGGSYTAAFGDEILRQAKKDDKIVAITAAMPDGTGLTQFSKELPDRFFDVGIAEQHAVCWAAGLAAGGLKPVCAIYSTFLQRAYDQLAHDVCLQDLPVRFMLDRGGLVGADGPTHHGAFDLSYLSMLPNMVIMAPRDVPELRMMVEYAVGYDDHPIAVRYPRGSTPDVGLPKEHEPIRHGKAELLRPGTDVALIGIGSMVGVMWEAARKLADLGVSAAVLNARFVKPLNRRAVLGLARQTGRLVIAEENVCPGGLGEAIKALLADEDVTNVSVRHLHLPDAFVEHGSHGRLLQDSGLTAADAVRAACELLFGEAAIPVEVAAAPGRGR
jgi:1-deoxy-D-xylulose-5-phosphate synthase